MLPRGVYAIVDGSAARPLELVKAFVEGGAAVVQLRFKTMGGGELLQLARAARKLTLGRSLLLINDRPDIAKLAESDGVHLGQEDLPAAEARRILGPGKLVGVSTHSDEEIDHAADADYIGFGPIFATQSKPGAPLPPPHGIEGLRKAVQRAGRPVVAIGGITAETARAVRDAGAHCIAAIAFLCNAPDPVQAVRSLWPVP